MTAVRPLRCVTDRQDEQPRPLLAWAVFSLAGSLVLAVDMAVWVVAFTVTNWMWPGTGRQPADWWVGLVLGAWCSWLLYGAMCRRLGWRD